LKSVSFTTDCNGNQLPELVPVLLADTGQWKFQDFKFITILTRIDQSKTWISTDISDDIWNPNRSNDTQELRVIFDHVDRTIQPPVHFVFAGTTWRQPFSGCIRSLAARIDSKMTVI
jgi:hypothetical protein